MKKGILIIALGHENYYRMAAVLAASIKVNDPSNICLVTDLPVQPEHAKLFDIVKPPTDKCISGAKKEYIKAKTYMYDLSPFEETIFLDADQIMIDGRKLQHIFTELRDINVTFSNTGLAGQSIWADMDEVKQLYGNRPFWNYHSEFVYFKKSKEAKAYFDAAKKVYADNKIKSAARFGGYTMADELAFQVAAMITGLYPHKENWLPNFWFDRDHREARKYPYQLTNYLTYSIGGKTCPANVKDNYNTLARSYFAKLGLSYPYQVEDKRNYLPGRKLI